MSQSKSIDNNTACPNCGSPLTFTNGTRKCTSCEYQLEVKEIDYSRCSGRLCMICGKHLIEDELQICQSCKDKIANNWRKQIYCYIKTKGESI